MGDASVVGHHVVLECMKHRAAAAAIDELATGATATSCPLKMFSELMLGLETLGIGLTARTFAATKGVVLPQSQGISSFACGVGTAKIGASMGCLKRLFGSTEGAGAAVTRMPESFVDGLRHSTGEPTRTVTLGGPQTDCRGDIDARQACCP